MRTYCEPHIRCDGSRARLSRSRSGRSVTGGGGAGSISATQLATGHHGVPGPVTAKAAGAHSQSSVSCSSDPPNAAGEAFRPSRRPLGRSGSVGVSCGMGISHQLLGRSENAGREPLHPVLERDPKPTAPRPDPHSLNRFAGYPANRSSVARPPIPLVRGKQRCAIERSECPPGVNGNDGLLLPRRAVREY